MTSLRTRSALTTLCLTLMACASAGPVAEPGADVPGGGASGPEKLIDGEFTNEHPEVGLMSMNGSACTGTLIRPNVVLTAAHCVEYQTFDNQNFGQFVIDGGQQFAMDAARSFAQAPGAQDIAVVRLSQAVPGNVAQPASVAARAPGAGSPALIYGYGCGDRNNLQDNHQGQKQRFSFTVGQGTFNLCPGDSGGPTFVGATSEIFHINSAYDSVNGDDIFGDAVALSAQVNAIADAWGGGQAAPGADGAGPQPAPADPAQPNDPNGGGVDPQGQDPGQDQGQDQGQGQDCPDADQDGWCDDPNAGGQDPGQGQDQGCVDADQDGWCDDPNAGAGGQDPNQGCVDADQDGWCDDPNAGAGGQELDQGCVDADQDGWCDDPNAGAGGQDPDQGCMDNDFDGWCDDPNAGGQEPDQGCVDNDFDGWCDDPNADQGQGQDQGAECSADADCGDGGTCDFGYCCWGI
jgi:V8-like Glu-specific endopeptidase